MPCQVLERWLQELKSHWMDCRRRLKDGPCSPEHWEFFMQVVLQRAAQEARYAEWEFCRG